ncbi:MAG: preprotein translocase subunit SecY [Ruminococcaceae bacterium]|nr:preprotein translocase subunit SecY [Oscillospiraceae bacterium]
MLQTLANAFKVPELRKKMLYTTLILFLFRVGAAIPVPFTFIDYSVGILGNSLEGNFMNYLSMMTGDAFNYGTLFAMSITPYINSSIIFQLLTVAIPPLERLAKEGEEGRKKIAFYTRIGAAVIAMLQSTAYYFYLGNQGYLSSPDIAYEGASKVFQALVIIFVLTAGSCLLMWMGESINEKGIGNGISMILFAGIVSRIPATITQIFAHFPYGGLYYLFVPLALIIMVALVIFIVWMDNSERRLPVAYAKRVVGRKMYGGQNTNMPIKVNMSGVMPIIFASSILSLPPTLQMFIKVKEGGFWDKFFGLFNATNWFYGIVYFLLIIFFAYFYATIQYNPVEMANNLRKNSGSIPGIRPGKPTSDYIAKVLSRITLLGALLISVVAILPIVFTQITHLCGRPMNISLGGTSVIILVGVALETVRQLESQMMMRHYKGFLD